MRVERLGNALCGMEGSFKERAFHFVLAKAVRNWRRWIVAIGDYLRILNEQARTAMILRLRSKKVQVYGLFQL